MPYTYTAISAFVFDQVLSFTTMNTLDTNVDNIYAAFCAEHTFATGKHIGINTPTYSGTTTPAFVADVVLKQREYYGTTDNAALTTIVTGLTTIVGVVAAIEYDGTPDTYTGPGSSTALIYFELDWAVTTGNIYLAACGNSLLLRPFKILVWYT